MSRTDPNQGWTTGSYPGDCQSVLVGLVIIGTINHYLIRELLPIGSRGMIKGHHSGLTVINDNSSGLSINL